MIEYFKYLYRYRMLLWSSKRKNEYIRRCKYLKSIRRYSNGGLVNGIHENFAGTMIDAGFSVDEFNKALGTLKDKK